MGDEAEAAEAADLMAKLGMDGAVESDEEEESMDPEEMLEKVCWNNFFRKNCRKSRRS